MSAPAASTHLPWTHLKSTPKKRRKHDRVLWLIGAGKIFYGLILLAIGIGALNFVGKNLSAELWRWVQWWNVDFHNHYIQMLFRKIPAMDGQRLYLLAFVTLAYAAVFFVEGTGLILEKYWAKWLVVVVTGSFIPGELYHLIREFSWPPLILLLLNAISVCYLVWRIKTHEHPHKSAVKKSRK
jgi:uncharacterized membrane protein (DUF2068 family)